MLQRTYTKEYYIRFMPSLVTYYRSPKMAASWLLLGDIWATQAKRKAEEERSREEKQRERRTEARGQQLTCQGMGACATLKKGKESSNCSSCSWIC